MQEKYSNLIVAFLKSHSLISVNAIEELLSMPQSTIGQAIGGGRHIPTKFLYPLICLLAGYGLKIDNYNLEYDDSDETISGRMFVENISNEEEGGGFAYIVKEYRFIAADFTDLI